AESRIPIFGPRPRRAYRKSGYGMQWGGAARSPGAMPPQLRRLQIAAGVNTKTLSTYIRHSSITITPDPYGHLLPGNEAEAADLLDNWLKKNITVRLQA